MRVVTKNIELSTIELMDLLKEDLIECCLRNGEMNLSCDEERHLIQLYKVLKPFGDAVMAWDDLRSLSDRSVE